MSKTVFSKCTILSSHLHHHFFFSIFLQAYLFLSIVLCVEVLLRASNFMYYRATNHTKQLREAMLNSMLDRVDTVDQKTAMKKKCRIRNIDFYYSFFQYCRTCRLKDTHVYKQLKRQMQHAKQHWLLIKAGHSTHHHFVMKR